jgi:hypothetical protein
MVGRCQRSAHPDLCLTRLTSSRSPSPHLGHSARRGAGVLRNDKHRPVLRCLDWQPQGRQRPDLRRGGVMPVAMTDLRRLDRRGHSRRNFVSPGLAGPLCSHRRTRRTEGHDHGRRLRLEVASAIDTTGARSATRGHPDAPVRNRNTALPQCASLGDRASKLDRQQGQCSDHQGPRSRVEHELRRK